MDKLLLGVIGGISWGIPLVGWILWLGRDARTRKSQAEQLHEDLQTIDRRLTDRGRTPLDPQQPEL
jgi:hypothetical protein